MKHGFARAYAKLNFTLDVLSRRDDGYHDLEMIMQSVSLYDSVAVRIGCGGGVTTISNVRHIPNDERNIAVKAASAFVDATGIDCGGIYIAIEKRIPSSAGLAGGSADGAAVLRLLNNLTGAGLSDERLCEIGAGFGSDVPFCLMGGTRFACSKGENMTELTAVPDCFVVIAKPRRGMSTKAVFEEIDRCTILRHPNTDVILRAIENRDLQGIANEVCNVFEPVVAGEIPDIYEIKRILCECGAMCAAMTGSGSAVFGIFEDKKSAVCAEDNLSARYSDVFVTRPINSLEVRECILKSQD